MEECASGVCGNCVSCRTARGLGPGPGNHPGHIEGQRKGAATTKKRERGRDRQAEINRIMRSLPKLVDKHGQGSQKVKDALAKIENLKQEK